MKRTYKNLICLTLALFLTFACGCGSSCNIGIIGNKLQVEEYGDFKIVKETDGTEEEYSFYNFSSQGLKKDYIIVPKEINGKSVHLFTKDGKTKVFDYSSNIKKVYIPYDVSYTNWERALKRYKNKTKIVYDKGSFEVEGGILYINDSIIRYTSIPDFCGFAYVNTSNLKIYNNNFLFAVTSTQNSYFDGEIDFMLANVQFMYNYEKAPNQGHYWIDDLETGETLTVKPPNPTREGYTFGGWYADSECTIPYNFTTPHVKKLLKQGVYEWQEIEKQGAVTRQEYYLYYPEDYVTYIYAKWI